MSGKLIVVVGGQYGSEGKGAVVDQLTRPERVAAGPVTVVRVAGPNAGHTVHGMCPEECQRGDDHLFKGVWIGHPWRLRAVPVGAVSNRAALLAIAAGSEIDLEVLQSEVDALDAAGYNVSGRLVVDPSATILTSDHIAQEAESDLTARLGSTSKGIGAARADRLWRRAETVRDRNAEEVRGEVRPVADHILFTLRVGGTVVIEGTQGFGLGLHTAQYPQVTSSDCRAIDFLAMAGVSPWAEEVGEFEVWVAARVKPIRVAGNSGPLRGETTWADLGLPEELTTVTKKVRRVGSWDHDLIARAIRENGGAPVVRLALTMADQVAPELAGMTVAVDSDERDELFNLLNRYGSVQSAPIDMVGTSPVTAVHRSDWEV